MANDLVIGDINPKAKKLVELYRSAQAARAPYEAEWRRVAELGLPREYGGWVTLPGPGSGPGTTGAARQARQAQFDSTLARAISKGGAVLERALTPVAQTYHLMRPSDTGMLRSRAVREYYHAYNKLLFDYRYHPRARFTSAQGQIYRSFLSYGNACKMVTWRDRPVNDNRTMRRGRGSTGGGLLYRSVPFSKMYWLMDHDEQLSTWFRRIDWTARQAYEGLGESCPKKVKEHYTGGKADQTRTFEFFQVVMQAEEYVNEAFDFRRFPLTSLYLFAEDPCIVKEPTGYNSQPMITPRLYGEDGCPYGWGAGQQVLSNVGSANATVKTMLKVGQKQADPPLLARDDGALSGTVDITPAAINYGGLDSQGREMIKPMAVGNLTVAEKLHASMQDDIKDAFFVTLLEILKDRPQMTATEIMQYAVDNASLLSPTMGLLQADDQGPQIEREIDLLEKNGLAPEKPAEVQDNPEYDMVYTSPLAKLARGEGIKGFVQLTNMAMEYAKGTNDTRPLKQLNFNTAMPEIADLLAVPPNWMNTPEEVAAEEQKDAQKQQVQTAVDLAPAAASVLRTGSSNGAKAA